MNPRGEILSDKMMNLMNRQKEKLQPKKHQQKDKNRSLKEWKQSDGKPPQRI